MTPDETGSTPSGGAARPAAPPGDPGSPRSSGGFAITGRTWLLLLAAGVVAGVLGWLSLEGSLRVYREALKPPMKPFPSREDNLAVLQARLQSGAVGFGLMGAWFGLVFGLAGGAARRSIGAGAAAALPGLVLGGLAVAATAWLVLPVIYVGMDPQSGDLTMPLLCHAAVWSVAGAAGGLAFGLGVGGRGRPIRAAGGGLIGAALATVVYELVGALGFPTHQTHLPVAGSPETRMLAQVLVGLGTAIGALLALEPKPKPSPNPEPSLGPGTSPPTA